MYLDVARHAFCLRRMEATEAPGLIVLSWGPSSFQILPPELWAIKFPNPARLFLFLLSHLVNRVVVAASTSTTCRRGGLSAGKQQPSFPVAVIKA